MKYTRSDLDEESEISGGGAVGSSAAVAAFRTDTHADAADTAAAPTVGMVGGGGSLRRQGRLHRLTGSFRRRSYLEKLTLTAVCILTLVVAVLAGLLYNVRCPRSGGVGPPAAWRVKYVKQVYNFTQLVDKTKNDTCTHPECIQLVARLLSNMNESADPCHDFYEFACGSFRQRVTIPAGKQRVNVFSLQSDANEILLRSLLESSDAHAVDTGDADAAAAVRLHANAASLYRSCMNDSARELLGVRPLLNLLASYGPWAALNATPAAFNATAWRLQDGLDRAVVFALVHGDSPPFYSLGVQPDAFNSSRRALQLAQPTPLLVRDDYVANKTANLAALTRALADVARLFGLQGVDDAEIRDIIELERKLAGYSLPESKRRDSTQIGNSTVKQLIEEIPCVNWTSLLVLALRNSSYTATNDTPVNIYDRPYFTHLCSLLTSLAASERAKRLTNNYLLVRNLWPFLHYLTPEAGQIAERLLREVRGVHGSLSPWQRCVKSTGSAFGFPLGKLFVERHFRGDSRASVQRLIDGVAAAFNASLAEAGWMDAATRGLAIDKLNAIRRLVGYPDYFDNATAMRLEWDDYRLLPDSYLDNVLQIQRVGYEKALAKLSQRVELEFVMTPQSVNAYYSPSSNSIAFPAGILQDPFYRAQFPAYIAHGAIGAVIGHEVTHGFDDNGRHYDRDGNRRQWWTNATERSFNRATDCVARQYEAFTVDGDVRVDGQLVMGESIADNGGLKCALRAYKQQQSNREQLLPYLSERYSKEQLLFVAYAQTWCELTTPESLRQLVTVNPHPPGQMRVWGPVSNSPEFAAAFSCRPGDRMNPSEKCTVW